MWKFSGQYNCVCVSEKMVSMTLCVEMLVVSITVCAWRWSIYVGGQYSCMCVGGRRVCELYILQHLYIFYCIFYCCLMFW